MRRYVSPGRYPAERAIPPSLSFHFARPHHPPPGQMWNYDLSRLEADDDPLATLSSYGTRADLEGVLGAPRFDPDTGALLSAEALSISYFLADRSDVVDGSAVDPINEAWEGQVFLKTVEDGEAYPELDLAYLSTRSFSDEFGGEISGDLIFVNVSYLGKAIRCARSCAVTMSSETSC